MLQTNTQFNPATAPGSARRTLLDFLSANRWLVGGLLIVIAVAGWGLARWLIGPEVAVYPVMRGDLVRTVVASGHVETPFRVNIGSQITGTVQDVLVDEGQSVREGLPLIALEPGELKATVVVAEGAVAQAEARVRQMRELTLPAAQEALKQSQATLTDAQAAYQRAEDLFKSGFGTKETLDGATKDLDVAHTQVRTAELQVYTSQPGGSDYVMAETELNQAKANLATARARLGYATITSPRDGVLITRNVERGAVVQPGGALLVLAPAGDIQLVLQIDEKNLGLLALGQSAQASADAYPDQRFDAKVTYINPSVDIARASVEVKLTVANPPAYLRQDMTVSVDIAVDRRPSTLIVPARVVHDPTSASPWVLVVRDGRARQQAVQIGLRASDQVEILSGLGRGDLVVPIAAGVRAGQRVRPVSS
ncbi:efflux RND transporter periplasmic adaptor subunit [Mesorhizobium erdmanii]|uniref:Efflux RND transporter periplasmic adaptor subunit n=1 Tax=Mesorhizobium erdmanii TaxID=1777866 RepID=A0A6M7UII6_9HYPH|nr:MULTISPECIES: efflux RND transporter periplasmic adaptor subunit [Mesorhizobium]OBQ57828.1 efflux transporter periplasmic adaptor subunit [Mesorhizobium loti]QKC75577.1 efflux RND transporter periplasmic adaptor subunit [Mesorhizobium erdmanii]